MSNKEKKVEELDEQIEDLELDEMSEAEIAEVARKISATSAEGLEIRLERRKVRYQLYRLRTEAEGKNSAECEEGFKEIFEEQAGFGGWRFFANTWDVSIADPYKVVSRDLSEQEEWENVVESKFPQIQPGGKIVYPDLLVKEKVDAESAKRRKANEKKKAKGK